MNNNNVKELIRREYNDLAKARKLEMQETKKYGCPSAKVQRISGAVFSCSSRPCHFSSFVLGGGPGN